MPSAMDKYIIHWSDVYGVEIYLQMHYYQSFSMLLKMTDSFRGVRLIMEGKQPLHLP